MTNPEDQEVVNQPEAGVDQGAESRQDIGYEAERAAAMARSGTRQQRKFGLLRWLIVTVVLLVIGVVITLIVTQVLRAGRRQPLSYNVYPGAVLVKADNDGGKTGPYDDHLYSSTDSLATVAQYYTQSMGLASGDNPNGCRVGYLTDNSVVSARCLLDSSQDDQSQILQISIEVDPATKKTMIDVHREWGE